MERVYFEIDEDKLDQWEKPQIKESKKAFFYATISDGGDKEKMECFVKVDWKTFQVNDMRFNHRVINM